MESLLLKEEEKEKIREIERQVIHSYKNKTQESSSSEANESLDKDEIIMIDLWNLRELGLKRGGFVNAETRQWAWKHLLGLGQQNSLVAAARETQNDDELLQDNQYFDLIKRDVKRSVLYRYNNNNNNDDHHVKQQEENLIWILHNFTSSAKEQHHHQSKKNGKCYYQGLHDLTSVLIYNDIDRELCLNMLHQLSKTHLRDALKQQQDVPLQWYTSRATLFLLQRYCQELHHHFLLLQEEDDVLMTTITCTCILPWMTTWFTHDVMNARVSSRLVDAFICAHATFPLYVAVALVIRFQNEIRQEQDLGSILCIMRGLPKKIVSDWETTTTNVVSTQSLIDLALDLMRQLPPRSLQRLIFQRNDNNDSSSSNDLNMMMMNAQNLALLKGPPSWALASQSGSLVVVANYTFSIPKYPRAMTASGIELLIHQIIIKPSPPQQQQPSPLVVTFTNKQRQQQLLYKITIVKSWIRLLYQKMIAIFWLSGKQQQQQQC